VELPKHGKKEIVFEEVNEENIIHDNEPLPNLIWKGDLNATLAEMTTDFA
jgi:hypothetical protein